MKSLVLKIAVVLSCSLPAAFGASVFTGLHAFSVFPKGAQPESVLLQAGDGNFYGTTVNGGSNGGFGTVFRVTTNAVMTTLVSFANSNGAYPFSSLIQGADGNFYGTCSAGGASGDGTIFQVTSNGTLNTLYEFTGINDSGSPYAGLLQTSDGNLYGTASGINDNGSVFRITTNGAFSVIYSFTGGADGAAPEAPLIKGADGNLYGTTEYGGDANGDGTVFQITTNGGLTTLYTFTAGTDSANPLAPLLQASDGNFYGTTSGYSDNGVIFQLTPGGTFTTLYPFTGGADGGTPVAGLVQAANGILYGTTEFGGDASGDGTIFQITTNGAFASVHQFANGADGSDPLAGLMQARDKNLYGTTALGNTNAAGTIFRFNTPATYATWFLFPGANDGGFPSADLALGKDGNLYGTAESGGAFGNGVIFKATPGGAVNVLHSFTGLDGASPEGILAQGTNGLFYGTASGGGANYYGAVFSISSNGAFALLYSFGANTDTNGVALDGDSPWAGLVRAPDGTFYGTTLYGGVNDAGTIFQITTNGSLTTLVSLDDGDGANPYSTLIFGTDGNLYGTCSGGGAFGYGSVIQVTTGGQLTSLYSFTGATDGAYPEAGLVQATNSLLYGTTSSGGDINNDGTIFQTTTSGSLATLAQFNYNNGSFSEAPLTLGQDGNFYGATAGGGDTNGDGVLFQVTPAGVLTPLWIFNGASDGAGPDDALIPAGNGVFYGMAENAGAGGNGTLFRINLAPQLQNVVKTNGTLAFNWNAVIGLDYQPQFKTNLAQPAWASLGPAVLATNQTMKASDSIGPGPRRFYHVVLLP